MRLVIGLAMGLVAVSSHGAEVEVYARHFTHSCGYYSSTYGESDVTFRDRNLGWGTKVTLVHGWEGYVHTGGGPYSVRREFTWRDQGESVMESVAPFTWRTRIGRTTHTRSSAQFIEGFDFVFKVEAEGRTYYVNGGNSSRDYYRANLTDPPHHKPCVRGDERPDLRHVGVSVVDKP